MALEALLPSEVSRLIYGYLIDENCVETASTFLNESPNLLECRNVLSCGKHFTTRVCGYTLLDILEKFCTINSIVQEKVEKFNNTDKLRNFSDVVSQIKFFVEEYKGQLINTGITTQNQSTVGNASSLKSHKECSSCGKDEYTLEKTGETSDKELRTQIQTNFNSIADNTTVETTLLKDLPGYIKDLQNEKYETSKFKSVKKLKESSKIENYLQNDDYGENILQKIKNENQCLFNQRYSSFNKNNTTISTETNFKKYVNCGVQTSERWYGILEKKTIINSTEEQLKNDKNSEEQTLKINSSDLKLSSNNECIELISDLSLELLNRTEIQEKIADNINKILEPIKSILFDKSNEEDKEELNKSFIVEFNKAIEVAINKTENDPDFLELVNEIIPENKEILNSEDEIEMDNVDVNNFKEQINVFSKENVSENNHKLTELENIDQNTHHILDDQNSNKIMNVDQINFTKNEKCSSSVTTVKQINSSKRHANKIPINDTQNTLINNTMILLNPLESPILHQKTVQKSNNFFSYNNTTSTPIKACTEIQNFDTDNWFSTQDLLRPNIMYNKDDAAVPLKTNTYTTCETLVTTVASHLSPIISKDTNEIAERITAISYLSTNAIIDQTLQTPEIYSPKINISSNIPSTFSTNIMSKYKTPFRQKSSKVIDELLNFNSSQKLNENVDNLSPLLKDNNEYNKYFSIESIMLYGMDNNISTVKTPLAIPEIEVEDSITLTGTGLSPFLKIHKKSDGTPNIPEKNFEMVKSLINKNTYESETLMEKNDNKITDILINERPSFFGSLIEKNDKFLTNTSQIIMKHTPTKLLENQSKNNRLSLSTPKKPTNYVRALNFNTPVNKSYSESKLKDKQHCFSSEMLTKNLKNSCKSSLFQSPPFTNSDIIEGKQYSNTLGKDGLDATNLNPINKETCTTNKAYVNKKNNFDEYSKEISFSKINNCDKLININEKDIKNKIWDSDLRKYLDQDKKENRLESKKPSHKKKTKEDKDRNVLLVKKKKKEKTIKIDKFEKRSTSKKIELREESNISNKKKKANVDKNIVKNELTKSKNPKTAKDLYEILSESKNNDPNINEKGLLKSASEEMNNLTKINDNNDHKKLQDEKIMLVSFNNVEKNLPDKCVSNNNLQSKKLNEKIIENSSENKNHVNYENIEKQLSIITNTNVKNNSSEKIEVIYDRVNKLESGKIVQKKYARLKTLDTNITKSSFTLDKNNSSLNNFALKPETPQKDENTLHIPPTPQILSPGSSSLTMPISKLNEDSRTIQSLVATPLECPLTPQIVLTPPKTINNFSENSQKPKNSPTCQSTLNAFESLNKSEITQFKVIKENLLKNKNIKIQPDNKKIDESSRKSNPPILYREKEVNSKSDSSSNSSSSSCTCNSCLLSSSSDSEEDKPNSEDKDKRIKERKTIDAGIEASPEKLFPMSKPEEKTEELAKKSPAKNESRNIETKLLETSRTSEVIENSTNSNTKMMLKEEETKKVKKSKVNVISVEQVSSEIVAKPSVDSLKPLSPNVQTTSLEVKNKVNEYTTTPGIKIETSEEVAEAVQSIITDKNKKINDSKDSMMENVGLDSSLASKVENGSNEVELAKAIESITKTDCELQQSELAETTRLSDEGNKEMDLEFMSENKNTCETLSTENNKTKQKLIENCNSSVHRHNTRFKSRQMMTDEKKTPLSESNGLNNYNASCQDIQYVFDENNYKRKRRKIFNDDELMWEFRDENGDLIIVTEPTSLDIIFTLDPAKKKLFKQTKAGKKSQIVDSEDNIQDLVSNHSNNNILIPSAKTTANDEKEVNRINNKRKRAASEIQFNSVKKKRKNNMFIL